MLQIKTEVCLDLAAYGSQSLLNQVNASDPEKLSTTKEKLVSQSLLNQVNASDKDSPCHFDSQETLSQSLLNQVNASDMITIDCTEMCWNVAIPSKSGQCFRYSECIDYINTFWCHVAIPSKSGQCFRYWGKLAPNRVKPDVAIPSKSGQCFRWQYWCATGWKKSLSQSLLNQVNASDATEGWGWSDGSMSQSLLNQVNASDFPGVAHFHICLRAVAIPSKSGQCFRFPSRAWGEGTDKSSQSLLNQVNASDYILL